MIDTPPSPPGRDVSAVLREAFAIYARNFRILVMLVASVYVPVALVSAEISSRLLPRMERVSQDLHAAREAATQTTGPSRAEIESRLRAGKLTPEDASRMIDQTLSREQAAMTSLLRDLTEPGGSAAWILAALLAMGFLLHGLGEPLCSAAITVAVTDRLTGGSLTFEEAWHVVLRRSTILFSALVPSGLLVAVGLLFFLVPGLVLGLLFAFVATVSILEGKGVGALRRSVDLVRADWQRVLALGILVGLLRMVAQAVGSAIAGESFLGQLLEHLLVASLAPLPQIGLVLLYLDQRRLREGLTIDLLRQEAHLDDPGPHRATSPA